MFEIKIENLDELRRSFQKAPKLTDGILQNSTKTAGKRILATEKAEVPTMSGALRRSIKMEYTPIQVIIRPNKEYAIYVHDGTGVYGVNKRPIIAKNAKFLRFKINGKWIYKKSVVGQQPNPFVCRS